jgi:hypothetical protein
MVQIKKTISPFLLSWRARTKLQARELLSFLRSLVFSNDRCSNKRAPALIRSVMSGRRRTPAKKHTGMNACWETTTPETALIHLHAEVRTSPAMTWSHRTSAACTERTRRDYRGPKQVQDDAGTSSDGGGSNRCGHESSTNETVKLLINQQENN